MSGDGTLVVNFTSLQDAAVSIGGALKKIDAELATVDREGKSLMSSWESEAQQAYTARQDKWTRAADDLKAILLKIQHAVEESGAEYLNTEKRATGLFQ